MHRVTLNLIDCEEIMVLNTVCEMYYQECHSCCMWCGEGIYLLTLVKL